MLLFITLLLQGEFQVEEALTVSTSGSSPSWEQLSSGCLVTETRVRRWDCCGGNSPPAVNSATWGGQLPGCSSRPAPALLSAPAQRLLQLPGLHLLRQTPQPLPGLRDEVWAPHHQRLLRDSAGTSSSGWGEGGGTLEEPDQPVETSQQQQLMPVWFPVRVPGGGWRWERFRLPVWVSAVPSRPGSGCTAQTRRCRASTPPPPPGGSPSALRLPAPQRR